MLGKPELALVTMLLFEDILMRCSKVYSWGMNFSCGRESAGVFTLLLNPCDTKADRNGIDVEYMYLETVPSASRLPLPICSRGWHAESMTSRYIRIQWLMIHKMARHVRWERHLIGRSSEYAKITIDQRPK